MGRRSLLCVLFASALAGLGLAVPSCWFLALLGLALFLYVLWFEEMRIGTSILYGLVFGTVSASGGVIWLLSIYPIARLGVASPLLQGTLVGGTWFLTALVLGIPVAIGAPLLRLLRSTYLPPFAASLLWALIEEARMWAYALFTLGPGSFFGPHFSSAAIGYALTEQPYLLQLAHPGGLLALDALAAFLAGTLALLPALSGTRYRLPAFMSIALLACLLAYPMFDRAPISPATRTLRVALISAHDEAGAPNEFSARTLLQEAASTTPDVVVFPEGYGSSVAYPDPAERARALTSLFAPKETLIMGWAYERTVLEYARHLPGRDLLEYTSTTRGTLATYTKIYLMPVGEYEPAAFSALYGFFDAPAFRRYLSYLDNAIASGDRTVAVPYGGTIIGGLLCSDLIAPSLYPSLVRHGHAEILVNLGNQNWFHHSPLLYGKTLQMARVAAVETRRPFLAANDDAPAFALAPTGALVGETPWNSPGVLVVNVPTRGTVYP